MKKLILFLLLIGLASCNIDDDRILSDDEVLQLQKNKNDSIMVILDSLNSISVYVPPLYDKSAIDSSTAHVFFELARATNGELSVLVNSQLISREIIHVIEKHAVSNADILFLIDNTGSMHDDILRIQEGLKDIINSIKSYEDIRIGIGLYGDKNVDPSWYVFKNFGNKLDLAKDFIDEIKVMGGGDTPESVYDGFFKTTEENFWHSDTKRMILLIGDAPPLESPLSDYTMDDVIKRATSDQIIMNFYPIVVTPSNDVMEENTSEYKTYKPSNLVSTFYPNPSAGKVTLNFNTNDIYTLQLFDFKGMMVSEEKIEGDRFSKELYDLPNGAYVIRIIDSSLRYEVIKFILNK